MRIEVLQIIGGAGHAVSLTEIQNNLQNFDRVTLYRTLQSLTEKGIIHKALDDETGSYFALCKDECSSKNHHHHHIHFRCKKCEEVYCLSPKKELDIQIPGFKLEGFEVEATGVCESCLS